MGIVDLVRTFRQGCPKMDLKESKQIVDFWLLSRNLLGGCEKPIRLNKQDLFELMGLVNAFNSGKLAIADGAIVWGVPTPLTPRDLSRVVGSSSWIDG